jgi:catechol 2,3-dioxygenase-like lactoylglutathione lyase family enzyme
VSFKWDHLHLRSLDPDAAAAFYEKMFGAEQQGRIDDGKILRVIVNLAGTMLFIERVTADAPRAPAPPYLGVEHFGLGVDNIEEILADLRSRGVEIISGPVDNGRGVIIAFLRGPDDVRIELLQRPSN